MAAPSNTELEVIDAKARLREAAAQMSLPGYVRDHPYRTLGMALIAGLVLGQSQAGRNHLSTLLIDTLAHGMRG